MSPGDLFSAMRESRFPKWATACTLRYLGLETLDGVFLPPGAQAAIPDAISLVSGASSDGRVLVRSDGGIESKTYYRGGNSYQAAETEDECLRLLDAGRAALLFESTNRFTNRLSANLTISYSGTLEVETLGHGFDVSDLNRGGIVPAARYTVRNIRWGEYRELRPHQVKTSVFDEPSASGARIARRLSILATEILPRSAEFRGQDVSESEAEIWLRRKGFVGLWEPYEHPTPQQLRVWFDAAFMIADGQLANNWTCLCASASVLENGRLVYWDVVDSAAKFKAGAPPT